MAAPEREPAGEDVALLAVGRPKGGAMPPGGPMPDDMAAPEESLPPGFESAAAEAFPEMDAAQYPALKRLIALCMESPEY